MEGRVLHAEYGHTIALQPNVEIHPDDKQQFSATSKYSKPHLRPTE